MEEEGQVNLVHIEHLKDLPIKEKTEISWFFPSQDGAVDKERCILHT